MISSMSLSMMVHGEDLQFTRNVSVEGNFVASSQVWAKDARERSATGSPTGNIATLPQCDLKRTLTIDHQTQGYLVIFYGAGGSHVWRTREPYSRHSILGHHSSEDKTTVGCATPWSKRKRLMAMVIYIACRERAEEDKPKYRC